MLELIFLLPVAVVISTALFIRYFVKKKPFTRFGISIGILSLVAAFALPLSAGVWIPDFLGQTRIIGEAKNVSGERFEMLQTWNYIDFYTNELRVTQPDGKSKTILVDGDASKNWSADLVVNEDQRTVRAIYSVSLQSYDIPW